VRLGALFRIFPNAIYENREEAIVRTLEDAVSALAASDLNDPRNAEALRYFQRLILAQIEALEKPSNGILRKARVNALKNAFRKSRGLQKPARN
jgi:hypothetical protein